MKRIALILLALCSLTASAQEVETKIFFKQDKVNYEPLFRSNIDNMKKLQRTLLLHEIDSVTITGSASIEGANSHNEWLGMERAKAVKAEVARVNNIIINTKSIGEDWADFIRLVELSDLEDKAEILEIARSNDENDAKERKMMAHKDSWAYISENILPNQRAGVSIVVYYAEEPQLPGRDTVIIERIIEKTEIIDRCNYVLDTVSTPVLALKTNLLYDVVTAVNLEIEVPIGEHWSITGQVVAPWWSTFASDYTNESRSTTKLLYGNLEARYWFEQKDALPLTGWYLGAYVGAGRFDWERDFKGHIGEFYGGGLSVGYAHRVFGSDNFRLEYGISVGYVHTQYSDYTNSKVAINGQVGTWVPTFTATHVKNLIMPTELSVTLSWVINNNKVSLRKVD